MGDFLCAIAPSNRSLDAELSRIRHFDVEAHGRGGVLWTILSALNWRIEVMLSNTRVIRVSTLTTLCFSSLITPLRPRERYMNLIRS
jgi:hypothetical protein